MNKVTMHVPESEAKEIRKLLGVEEPTKDYGKYLPNTLSGLAAARDLDPMFEVLYNRIKDTLDKGNPYESARFMILTYIFCQTPADLQEIMNVISAYIAQRGTAKVPDKLLCAMMKEYDRMCDELEKDEKKEKLK